MVEERYVLASEKQLEAVKTFFDDKTEDMLFGGWARWGKSEVIGMILGICIAAFPGSTWLLSRTQLADLKATTLATFFNVIKRLGFWEDSYRDKVRDERHIKFVNDSRLFLIQTNLEPSDPEFDRVWSYGYTGVALDEAQQMANKLREVLSGRLSELDGVFSTEVPIEYANYTDSQLNPWYSLKFKIIGETKKNKEDIVTPEKDIKEIILDNGKYCVVKDFYTLKIPYKLIESEIVKWKLIHTYSWHYKGIIFSSCNPWSNYTKTEFYNPWKKKTLPEHMAFIPSLVWDNPWVDKKFIERLERLPESSIRKQRLLYGNFDFDDNPGILYDQNTLERMFGRIPEWDKTIYLTIDAARQGKDSTEIGRWEWLHLVDIKTINKDDLVNQANEIQMDIDKYGIDINNVIVDEVWVGWGLVDILGCRWFVGNSQPLQPYASKYLSYKKRNYLNLRTQAFYYLQRYMKNIAISCSNDEKDLIIEELLTVKEKDVSMDGKMQIIAKKLMKEELGRSPDKADMISMRMWWLIKEHHDHGEQDIEFNETKDKKETIESFIEGLIQEENEKNINNNFEPDLDVY